MDPETGIMYVASQRGHSVISLIPGDQRGEVLGGDDSNMNYVSRGPGGIGGPQGLPLLKPPYGSITAIDLNTGEHLWWIPLGDTPRNVLQHPALQGRDPGTGTGRQAAMFVTPDMLVYAPAGEPVLHAVDKRTGEEIGRVDMPHDSRYSLMTYMHEGKQYIVLSRGGGSFALTLPNCGNSCSLRGR